MKIISLHLINFRSYQSLGLALSPNINLFVGPNAQGKTNLLEAVGYCAVGRSFRTSNDRNLVRYDAPGAAVRLSYERRGVENELVFKIPAASGKKRSIEANGAPISLKNHVGSVNIVCFSPEDLSLIKGAPAGRRSFLDVELSQASPAYFKNLIEYDKILKQRNSLLKIIAEKQRLETPAGAELETLAVWDEKFAAAAAGLAAKRLAAVAKLEAVTKRIAAHITGGGEELSLKYEIKGLDSEILNNVYSSRINNGATNGIKNGANNEANNINNDIDDIEDTNTGSTDSVNISVSYDISADPADSINIIADDVNSAGGLKSTEQIYYLLQKFYISELKSKREREIASGGTLAGPHRDDLAAAVGGEDLRRFGSQGQQRTAALALKLAEAEFLKEHCGEYPVLLLDDVMSELDASRRQKLLDFVRQGGIQTLATATDRAYFEGCLKDGDRVYAVKNSQVAVVETEI